MVKLTKVNINPSSQIKHAESVRDYMENQESILFGKSPPIEYCIVGTLVKDIKVGESILLNRQARLDADSGELKRISGVTITSRVVKIYEEKGVKYAMTKNSVYKIENCNLTF
jgi:hypothetical protein